MGAWSPWENANYCWVVICKNKKFHRDTNLLYGHKIPLGETDAVSPAPALFFSFLGTMRRVRRGTFLRTRGSPES